MDGAGEEFAGVPLLLPVLKVSGFDVRDDGVTERLGSTLRFLAGGAFFVVVVAVPFFVFDGAGRFFETGGSGAAVSVDGTGTENSRNGEWVRKPCSFFREAMAFKLCASASVN